MLGLTTLGTWHTAISLVAVAAGFFALVRDKEISWRNAVGKLYVVTTAITCLTGFGIFQHGGFGKPHALGITTLVTLVGGGLAEHGPGFGGFSRQVEVVSYPATVR